MQLINEEDLRDTVLTAPIGICILNADTLIAEILNDKFQEVAGKPREAIIGHWYWKPFAEAKAYYEAALAGVVATGEPFYANEVPLLLIRHGREEKVFVTFVYAPVKDKGGKVRKVAVWVLENTHQVNEREKVATAKAALQRERDRLREFFMQAPAGICIVSGSELVYELVNPLYQQLFPGRDLLGKPLLEALPEIKGTPIWDHLQEVYQTGKTFEGNELLVPLARTPDGPVEDRYFNFIYQARQGESGEADGIVVFVIEVTETVTTKKAILERERQLRSLVMTSHYGLMILTGREWKIELVNQQIAMLWQKELAEITGKKLMQVLPELEGQSFPALLDQVFDTGIAYAGEEERFYLESSEGRVLKYVSFYYDPMFDAAGHTAGIIVACEDVTEKVKARELLKESYNEQQSVNEELYASNEELAATNEALMTVQQRLEDTNQKLAASESRLRMAIEATNLGTWEYQPTTGELYWSRECRDIYGIPEGEQPNFKTFSEHIHPEDRDRVQKTITRSLDPQGGGKYDLNYRILRFGNQETRWIRAQGIVYFDNNQATRFVGTVLDINEMKLAEEKSAKLAAIIETSDDAIISKTLESVITSWNDSAQRMFGYTADEMIGESIYKLIPADRQQEEPQILARLKSGDRVEHFETKRLAKDGRLIDVSLTISPIKDPEGRIIGLSKIARDITERKLDEIRKNDFIGMVSHELKTPLTSLNALLQMASLKLKDSSDGFLANAMEKSTTQVKRMTAIINGFLNISRLESGKIHIEKQSFEIESLISDMVSEAQLTAGAHDIRFAQCAALQVSADRDKIGSVISNLISNAIKYSPKGRNIEVACHSNEKELIVSVKDEGMGIKPDDLGKIFDRYYRVESSHTHHISGFGIGLYLSAEIIRRHDGRIWAESQSGVGSTFYFSLPVQSS
ncbi:PAS domain S-box protein [Mucilaginibacter sp.]|uniref:PAS domain S-box protein n=1 Tax=Mucilaginibacter sp. TaxID=1882438 RepID=UPI00262A8B12|nr:PAS domain S-box protein [Mucilaginibacter sp.]